MTLEAGQQVLQGRYRLVEGPLVSDEVSTSWQGEGIEDYKQYLIKVWPFEGDAPDPYKHALWLHELRILYRVSSSPGAEDSILILRDPRLDREARCFVMVAEAVGSAGYTPLAEALAHRERYSWLCNRDTEARCDLWQGLKRIADGLQLLHDQNTLHRNLGVEAVFFNPQEGTDSLRLGGFEWSIRLGQPVPRPPVAGWSTPPELFAGTATGYRPETDWYAFGMLVVRCLLNVEPLAPLPVPERHQRVLRAIDKATGRQLSDLERTFLQDMIDADPSSRAHRGDEVRATIREILVSLVRGIAAGGSERPLVLAISADNTDLVDRARAVGFIPNPDQPREAFNPRNLVHITNLTTFLQRDLAQAKWYSVPRKVGSVSGPDDLLYVLAGQQYFTLILRKFEYADRTTDKKELTWDVAYCVKT